MPEEVSWSRSFTVCAVTVPSASTLVRFPNPSRVNAVVVDAASVVVATEVSRPAASYA